MPSCLLCQVCMHDISGDVSMVWYYNVFRTKPLQMHGLTRFSPSIRSTTSFLSIFDPSTLMQRTKALEDFICTSIVILIQGR